MTSPSYVHCPSGCGEFRDTSGRYTSPANRERDRQWWQEEHVSGKCLTTPVDGTNAEAPPLPHLESTISEVEA